LRIARLPAHTNQVLSIWIAFTIVALVVRQSFDHNRLDRGCQQIDGRGVTSRLLGHLGYRAKIEANHAPQTYRPDLTAAHLAEPPRLRPGNAARGVL